MGEDFKRRSRSNEIDEMKNHIEEAMQAGAFGMSAGLDGGSGDFSDTKEIVELAKIVKKYGGFYASHTRNFDNNYPTTDPEEWGYGICHNISPEEMSAAKYYGLMETIEVARKAEIAAQVAHICPVYTVYHYYPEILQEAAAQATLQIIDSAREEGLDISFDVIPDEDLAGIMLSKIGLLMLFGVWVQKCGTKNRFIENLKIPAFRDELKKEIMNGKFKFITIHPKTDYYWMDRLEILECRNEKYKKKLSTIARENNRDPLDALFDIIIDDPDARFSCEDPRWTEKSVSIFLKHPQAMIGSDLNIVPFGDSNLQGGGGIGMGEPGLATYGIYPRYIRRFVREKSLLKLEEAIRKATGLPAKKLGLADRGILKPGSYADILIFDFAKIGDKGTWAKPNERPQGIINVIINGEVAYNNMTHQNRRPGKVLRRGMTE
jgi:N-acyl-D-amino-acid deacylase